MMTNGYCYYYVDIVTYVVTFERWYVMITSWYHSPLPVVSPARAASYTSRTMVKRWEIKGGCLGSVEDVCFVSLE
jgi:hypothetical protein